MVTLVCTGAVLAVAAYRSFETAGTGTLGDARPDVLVVFGSPADIDGTLTPMQHWRINEAVAEYKRGVAPYVLFSGGMTTKQFVEADVMAAQAERAGVPPSAIVRERESRTTVQNIRDFTPMLLDRGWRRAELISSPDHLPRIALLMRGSPLVWRLHAAPTPGRGRFATGLAYAEEAFAVLVLRVFGTHAEPVLHGLATVVHVLGFVSRWVFFRLRGVLHR